jgi:LDH2 family malate/lactate/ureidoglycolate dehydrogenase
MLHIQPDVLKQFMKDAFIQLGVPENEAEISAEILITSDLRGIESHGIGRLRMYVDRIHQGLIEPDAKPEIVRESPTTAVVDGNHGIGMVIGHYSMSLAIQKAREFGMGSVAVRNSTHFGIDGYYPLMAVDAGMIGMSFTNARPSVTPTFSVQPVLGTNPIAFGAPTDEEFPFLYDAATSITQRGKIEVLHREEKPLKAGWVVNNQGELVDDPDEVLAGLVSGKAALLPLGGMGEELGGHKGFGLSAMVEIFSASLQSGAFLSALSGLDEKGNPARYRVGHFFMAINIENFVDLPAFKKNIGDLLRELRMSKKAPGQSRIFTAGEKEYISTKDVRERGVPINENLRQDLLHVKRLLDLDQLVI